MEHKLPPDDEKQEELPELDDEDLPLPPPPVEDLPLPPLPVKDLPLPPLADKKQPPDDKHSSDDVQRPLEEAWSLIHRGRQVSDDLFEQARNMPEYRRVLATRERNAQFESKLLDKAKAINSRLGTDLPDNALIEMVRRMANSIAAWEHSPQRQRERQRKQVQKRRRGTLGRDLQIVRYIEDGESQRRVAARYEISRGAVENVLRRDAPHLLKRREPPKLPD